MPDKLKRIMSPFQWFECIAIIGVTVFFALTNSTDAWWYILLDSAAAVCGVFSVVLCAGGRKSQFFWGIANVTAYAVIAFVNRYYGEVMLNVLYYLPTQFIGLRSWSRHYNEQNDAVEGRRMNLRAVVLWSSCSFAGILIYGWILRRLGGSAPMLDSMSTVLSITANALMVLRYREQWALWIIIDAVTVVMWLIAGDLLMTVMWAIYLMNAIYGFIMWSRMSKRDIQGGKRT